MPASTPDDGRPRFALDGRTYLIEGRLGRGDSCEVYRGRWVMRLGELVVIKVLRAPQDADLVRREKAFVDRLHASPAKGAEHFVGRLPQPIALGPVRIEGVERTVAIYQWHSGFLHTLEEVRRHHPDGVDGRIVVWILKRLLEVLSFAHRSGVVHGAITPAHALVHPRDHGAMLVGWATATACSGGHRDALPAISAAWERFYPREVVRDRWVSPATDLAMAARCALYAAGTMDFDDTKALPGGLGILVSGAAWGSHDDAWALRDRVDREAADVYGPPRYNPLPMPGWAFAGG